MEGGGESAPPICSQPPKADPKTCSICFEQFTRRKRVPISLVCGHTFCAACIQGHARARSGQGLSAQYSIECGFCRAVTFAQTSNLRKNVMLLEYMEEKGDLADTDSEEEGGENVPTGSQQQPPPPEGGNNTNNNNLEGHHFGGGAEPTFLLELLQQFHLAEQTIEGIGALRGGATSNRPNHQMMVEQFRAEIADMRRDVDRELQELTSRFLFADKRRRMSAILERLNTNYVEALNAPPEAASSSTSASYNPFSFLRVQRDAFPSGNNSLRFGEQVRQPHFAFGQREANGRGFLRGGRGGYYARVPLPRGGGSGFFTSARGMGGGRGSGRERSLAFGPRQQWQTINNNNNGNSFTANSLSADPPTSRPPQPSTSLAAAAIPENNNNVGAGRGGRGRAAAATSSTRPISSVNPGLPPPPPPPWSRVLPPPPSRPPQQPSTTNASLPVSSSSATVSPTAPWPWNQGKRRVDQIGLNPPQLEAGPTSFSGGLRPLRSGDPPALNQNAGTGGDNEEEGRRVVALDQQPLPAALPPTTSQQQRGGGGGLRCMRGRGGGAPPPPSD